MKKCLSLIVAAAIVAGHSNSAQAAGVVTAANYTNNTDATSSWNVGTNWDSGPTDWPSGTGASASFTGPSVTRTVNLVAATTAGALTFDNNTTFATTISNGGGSFTFNTNSGPAMVTVNGTGGQTNTAGKITLGFTSTLAIPLIAVVNQTNASSSTGGLEWTGGFSTAGSVNGSFTKQGVGLMTLSTGNKNWGGPTVLDTEGGRTRLRLSGVPGATSSFTIKSGSQLTMSTDVGTYQFGANTNVPLNLNGAGPTTGPFAIFPGAIRNDTNLAVIIPNKVALQSDTLLHVEGSATGSITLSNSISGPGSLSLTAPNSSANQGQLVLNGANSYAGGTLVRGGTLVVSGASATLGTGNVTISNATSVGSIAKLMIAAGVSNAIDNSAILSLAGGGAAGADVNYADLGAGINEIVGGLILGGVTQSTGGTYGSTSSTATFQYDDFFSGSGVITLVPGDYNGNGTVDAADYVLWRNGVQPLAHEVPPNDDMLTNGADYTAWRARFGSTSGSGSGLGAAAVPEPCSFILVGLLLSTLAAGRRIRNARCL